MENNFFKISDYFVNDIFDLHFFVEEVLRSSFLGFERNKNVVFINKHEAFFYKYFIGKKYERVFPLIDLFLRMYRKEILILNDKLHGNFELELDDLFDENETEEIKLSLWEKFCLIPLECVILMIFGQFLCFIFIFAYFVRKSKFGTFKKIDFKSCIIY